MMHGQKNIKISFFVEVQCRAEVTWI